MTNEEFKQAKEIEYTSIIKNCEKDALYKIYSLSKAKEVDFTVALTGVGGGFFSYLLSNPETDLRAVSFVALAIGTISACKLLKDCIASKKVEKDIARRQKFNLEYLADLKESDSKVELDNIIANAELGYEIKESMEI